MRQTVLRVVLLAAFVVVAAVALRAIVMSWDRRQWDFRSFYYAVKTYDAGLNPYRASDLSQTAGSHIRYPFVYPPVCLYLFRVFTIFDFNTARVVYFVLRLALAAGLIILWARGFLKSDIDPAFYLFCLLAFNKALWVDLSAGNVSLFQQALIWTGVYFYARSRLVLFCGAVLAASTWKLMPILFLGLLPFSSSRNKYACLLVSASAFVAIQTVSYLAAPSLYAGFIKGAGALRERGYVNPSLLVFVQDLGGVLGGGSPPGRYPVLAYAAIAGCIVAASFLVISRHARRTGSYDPVVTAFFYFVVYALIAPRFKEYSYILVLLPSFYILKRGIYSKLYIPLLIAILVPLMPLEGGLSANAPLILHYSSLLRAALVWVLYIVYFSRPAGVGSPQLSPQEAAGVIAPRCPGGSASATPQR